MPTAPLSLFKLLAHHSDGSDTHLQRGVHLRWFSSPLINLPFDQFQVERADASNFLEFFSDEVRWFRWFNGIGPAITPPFDLFADEEVVGLLPPTEDALAVQIQFDSAQSADLTGVGEVATLNGYQPVGTMLPNGWILVPGVQRLRLRGPGRILHTGWIQLSKMISVMEFQHVAQVGLPAEPKARYVGTPDFKSVGIERVMRGAPLRVGLHDDANAISPATAQPVDPARESDRVLFLARPDLDEILEVLLEDGSDIPIRLVLNEDLDDGVAGEMPLLATFLTALVDPGLARWLGFAELDTSPISSMTLYRVTGKYLLDEIDRTLLSNYQQQFLPETGSIELQAYCLANPQPDFASPPIGKISSPAAQSGPWISGGDDLRRLVSIEFNLPPGQVDFIALRRGEPGSGIFDSLNDIHLTTGLHLPIVSAKAADAADPRFRRLRDATAPPGAQEYGVAVADVFGRWSEWAQALLPEGVPVPPPAPVVRVDYLPADRNPVDDSLRSGQIRCRASLPESLPPGVPTITLAHFSLSSLEGGTETLLATQNVSIAPGMTEVSHVFTGPGLGRGERRTFVVRLQFLSGALNSEESAAQVDAADPRPPVPIVVIPDIHYATRPDGRNLSTIRLNWALGAGHATYRVYRSSQRALESFLITLGPDGTDALDLVRDPRATPQAIATAIQVHSASLPKDSFELLTRDLVRPDTAGTCVYTSTLPGRSRMLYLYRVLAVNAAGVEEEWNGVPALFYVAVPASIQLQPPRIELAQVGDQIRVSVFANVGQPAGAVRIFRSTNPGATLNQMTQILQAPVPPPLNGSEQAFTLLDSGASPFNPTGRLKEWSRYLYCAQLQALSQPGEPPGIWSNPSASAALNFIPPDPPPAPTITSLSRNGNEVTLSWESPALRIRATILGNHRYRVLRAGIDGGFMQEVATLDSLMPTELTDPDAPDGLIYIVETVDPIGRRTSSAPSDPV